MDDWTYPYPDVDVPDTQPPLLNEDRPVLETLRARAQQAEAARVAELEQTQAFDAAAAPPRQTSRCRSRRRPASS